MAQIKLMAGLQVFDLDKDIADASGKILGRKGDRIILMPQTLADAVQFMDGQSLAEKWHNLASRFKGGGSVSVTVDNEGTIVISGTDTTYGAATAAAAGLMSASDKAKLDGIARGAQTNPGAATQSASGLMSADDKKKLDGIASGATNTAAPPAAATAAPLAHGTATAGTSARYAREDHVHPSNNTDTHWTSHLYAGTSTGNVNAATANGATYLIICDNSTARDRRLIKGAGTVSVTSDANGNITITDAAVPKTGARGLLAGNETVQALSNSQTITVNSSDCINLATSGAVTLTFTVAAATVRAVKSICLTASAATTLTVKNAVWANNGSAPVWGAAGKILVLLAHFVGGRVVLSVADNTQG